MVTLTLSDEQERLLSRHAAARNMTPAEALDALLQSTPPSKRPWTETELSYLRDARNKPVDIARKFNRTVTAVSNRRAQLAREENLPALMRKAKDA